jgi:hypothetical protein
MRSLTPHHFKPHVESRLQKEVSFESVLPRKPRGYDEITYKVQTRRPQEVKSEKIYNIAAYKRSKLMK